MLKCSSCEKERSKNSVIQVLNKGMDYCTDEPDEHEISGKYVCESCLTKSVGDPNAPDYGVCGLDSEQAYALHVS